MKEKRLMNIVPEVYERGAVFDGEFIVVEKTLKKRYCGRHTLARLF